MEEEVVVVGLVMVGAGVELRTAEGAVDSPHSQAG